MFVYLSKKIGIPNGIKLRCAAWNADEGWIVAGGDGGLLKVLKLDGAGGAAGPAAAGSLTANQSLEGHEGAVSVAAWNEGFQKLTTSDDSGLIIVWSLQKGAWYEEMINNRNKSYVTDMKWSSNGDRTCIVYADGAVIVGSADGVRLWGKELSLPLTLVEWSPDGRLILFGTDEGDVHVYDCNGNAATKVQLHCNQGFPGAPKLVAVEWYDGLEGFVEPDCPTLAICCDNGRVQLMRHESDSSPICIDTGMKPCSAKWSRNGALLAIAGCQSQYANGETREVWMVQFYDAFGEHLTSLRVPGSGIQGLDWEAQGLRLVLAVDSYIYFASVRPKYKWAYFSNTLVYACQRPDRPEQCVTFWQTSSGEKYTKFIKRLAAVEAAGDHCVLAAAGEQAGEYLLILCNAIGSPVDSRHIQVEPRHVAISEQHVVAASSDVVYVWQYRSSFSKALATEAAGRRKEGRERIFHIDDLQPAANQGPDTWQNPGRASDDPITAITASNDVLLIGRASGAVYRYSLPHLTLEGRHTLRCRPQRLALNCSGTHMAVLDPAGVLTMFDFGKSGAAGEHLGSWERKDVWDVRWASDDPELLVCCEKGKMVVVRSLEHEEPVAAPGHVLELADLEVRCAALDTLMAAPEQPEAELISTYETRGLREARDLLESSGVAEATAFISSHSHPRLWRILANHCLQQLDLATAEKALVHCQDYPGIQLVKQLSKMDDATKQRAEVAAWLKDLDTAEQCYRQMDRPDLAVEMQMRLGDWFKVEAMLHDSGGADTELSKAWAHIGEHYADRHKWGKAAQYFTQARHTERLAQCLHHLEDYDSLAQLMALLPDNSPLLPKLGEQFQSVGLCVEAVQAFTRAGLPKRAVDCCVLLNQWDQAVALAQQHDFPQVEQLMARYASVLLEKQQHMEAVELYRKAGRHAEAAKLLVDLAKQCAGLRGSPLRTKKLHVLAGLEVDSFRRRALDVGNPDGSNRTAAATLLGSTSKGRPGATGGAATTAAQTLAGLMTLDAAAAGGEGGSPVDGAAWHGAEAYHFWLLAHRQLYGGDPDAALRTCLALRRYEDVLGPAAVYSLLALTAFYAKFYEQCSKAFVKLESLPSLPAEQREALANLAAAIFLQHPPVDVRSIRETRDKRAGSTGGGMDAVLEGLSSDQDQVCVATGRIIRDVPTVRCKVCRHSMIAAEVRARAACPLCHSDLYSQPSQPSGSSSSAHRGGGGAGAVRSSTGGKLRHAGSGDGSHSSRSGARDSVVIAEY